MDKAKFFLGFGAAATGLGAFNAAMGWWIASAFHATAALLCARYYRAEMRGRR